MYRMVMMYTVISFSDPSVGFSHFSMTENNLEELVLEFSSMCCEAQHSTFSKYLCISLPSLWSSLGETLCCPLCASTRLKAESLHVEFSYLGMIFEVLTVASESNPPLYLLHLCTVNAHHDNTGISCKD